MPENVVDWTWDENGNIEYAVIKRESGMQVVTPGKCAVYEKTGKGLRLRGMSLEVEI